MSLMDNFKQAMRELLDGDLSSGTEKSDDSANEPKLTYYSEPQQVSYVSDRDESGGFSSAEAETYGHGSTTSQAYSSTVHEESSSSNVDYYEPEEVTIISINTLVEGNIRSLANISIEGNVNGNVQVAKDAAVTGKLVGNLNCNNVSMLGSSMQGNVNSKGRIAMNRDSLLLGNINAQQIHMNGKIKGNLDIGGKAEIKNDAVVFGNINAYSVSVLDGAIIQGYVNTTVLQDSLSNYFPDAININE